MTNQLERAFWLQQQAKAMTKEAAEILEAIGKDVGKEVEGDYILTTSEVRRFNAAEAKKHLSAAKFKKILKSVPDAKMARAFLEPEDLEKTFTIGLARSVKPVNDIGGNE